MKLEVLTVTPLFASNGYTSTYLIDNCGRLVNEWPGNLSPGSVNYLLEDGSLLRAVRVNDGAFFGGGSGGRIERLDWDGNLMWFYEYATEQFHQHHDIEMLPNGNVLLLAWERKTQEETIEAGRNPVSFTDQLWPDHIVEVEPQGLDGGNIVWEWHIWDHLIQDYDPGKANFGSISNHPELMDVNFVGVSGAIVQADWTHCNAIDYIAERDEIIISSRHLSEFWIIDHSTSTEEAASHSGGNSGKGGDILYRWGNPYAYKRANQNDQYFFGQHHVHCIPEGLPDAGKIMIFNNGLGRPGGNASSVDILTPPLDANGQYEIIDDAPFGPESIDWTYFPPLSEDFFSSTISGAQRLPNGNTLICEGSEGHLFEINIEQEIVWEYVCPVGSSGPEPQGNDPNTNSVFRAYRYAPDYPAFNGKDLTPGDVLELDPIAGPCDTTTATVNLVVEGWTVFPNPFDKELAIKTNELISGLVQLVDAFGRVVYAEEMNGNSFLYSTSHLPNGIYLLVLLDGRYKKILCIH